MKNRYPKFTSGMTVIEVVVATAMTAILGVVMMMLVIRANALSGSAKYHAQAAKLAEQMVERTRGFRNQQVDWDGFRSKATASPASCYAPSDTNFSELLSCPPPPAKQVITPVFSGYLSLGLLSTNNQIVVVTAYVTYNDHDQQRTVTASTYLADVP